MAASHAFRELLVIVTFTTLLKPRYYPKAFSREVNAPVDQLGMFFAGQFASVVNCEVYMVSTKNSSCKNDSVASYSGKISMLLRLSKVVLIAELNISTCLLFCGDIELNPGPNRLNSFDLPRKGLRFGQ